MKLHLSLLSLMLLIPGLLSAQEAISIIDFSGVYPANVTSYPVKVSYTLPEKKDLFLEIQYNNKYIGGTRITVEAGSGDTTLTATFDSPLTSGNDYSATASIRTVGGNWTTISESDTKWFTIEENGTSGSLTEVYVSNTGDDTNEGTISAPVKTIQKASELLAEGGTCYIRGGIYRETVTVAGSNQTFTNFNGEYVEVSGTDLVSGWTQHEGDIYKATFTGVEPQFTQVFHEGKYQKIARYPDLVNEDRLVITDGYTDCNVYKDGAVTFDKTLPGDTDHWKGGYFRGINGLTWWNPMGKISASSGKNLTCDMISKTWQDNTERSIGNGVGFILHLNALSKAGEWYYENNTLYFWKPGGGQPSDTEVEAQRRTQAFNLDGQSGITLKNLHIKAATISMNNSNNCNIEGCSFRYQKGFYTRSQYHWSYTDHGGVYVQGNNNRFDACYFKGSWGNLVNVENGSGNIFFNCIFEDNGWISQFTSCIQNGSENLSVEQCTFGSTGRFHIRSDRREHSNKIDILHNDFYDCMKISQDAGSIEVTNGGSGDVTFDMGGSEIAYNRFHDMSTISSFISTKNFVVVLYLEGADNYTAHHNLVYNIRTQHKQGAFIYLGPRDCVIDDCNYYNNTVWNVDKMIGVWNRTPEQAGIEDMEYTNNIFYGSAEIDFGSPSLESGVTFTTNLSSTDNNLFTDAVNGDFTLKDGSAAIDYGTSIPGITDGFQGTAPDAGCFEKGVAPWNCGANMSIPVFPEDTVPQKFILEVNSGSGGGYYEEGAEITISADLIDGKVFVEWTGDVNNLAESKTATTTVTIPGTNISLTALYADAGTGLKYIQDNGKGTHFTLYPNPTSDKSLTIMIGHPEESSETLSIFDIHGSLIQQFQIQTNVKSVLRIEELIPGIYFTKAGSDVQKMVVQ